MNLTYTISQNYKHHSYHGNLSALSQLESEAGIKETITTNQLDENSLEQVLKAALYAISSGHSEVFHHIFETFTLKEAVLKHIEDFIYFATDNERHDLLKFLLDIDNKQNIHLYRKGLITAATYGNLFALKIFHEAGADLCVESNKSVRRAIEHNHLNVVQYLVENGANPFAKGKEAIKNAAKNGHVEILEFLLSHGGDKNLYRKYARSITNKWLDSKDLIERLSEDLCEKKSSNRLKV